MCTILISSIKQEEKFLTEDKFLTVNKNIEQFYTLMSRFQ